MKKLDPKNKKKTDRIWLMLTHPDEKNKKTGAFKPQGYVEVSIEVLPKKLADEMHNGFGQEARNMFPVLPAPTGRFKFDLFSPWKMLKECLGPSLARKVVCVFC